MSVDFFRFRRRDFSRRLVIFTGLLLSVMHLGNGLFIERLYRTTARAEDQNRSTRATVLAEHASRSLSAVDMTLVNLAEKLANHPKFNRRSVAIHMLLHEQAEKLPQLRAITAIDEQGRILHDSRHYPASGADVSDRPYFAEQKKWRGVGLLIDGPRVALLTDGLPYFAISEPILDSNGNVYGVVAALAEPTYFAKFYDEAKLGGGSAAALVGDDGVILAESLPAGDAPPEPGASLEKFLAGHRDFVQVVRKVPGFPVRVAVASRTAFAVPAFQSFLVADMVIMTLVTCLLLWMCHRLVAEARARETAERRLLDAIESAPAGFALFDAEDRLVMLNRQILTFSADSPAGMRLGTRFEDMIRNGADRRIYGLDDTVATDWVARRLANHRDGGEIIQQLATGRWVFTCERRTQEGGVVCFETDITQLKQQEEALRLSGYAERVARERAELADRAKNAFLATMSHELRTPLNAIIGFSEMIERQMFGWLQPRYAEYGALIRRSGSHLHAIINDILDIAKLQSGRMELNLKRIDIAQLVGEAQEFLAGQAHDHQITLRCDIDPELPELLADPVRVRQVLTNLLSNAVKFTPQGGQVLIKARRLDRSLVVEVTDTGIGIAASDLPRVLEPFGQIANSMTRSEEGTGLGLPLSKSLIELHAGSLAIDSEVGKGTTVRFTLPLDGPGALAPGGTPARASASQAVTSLRALLIAALLAGATAAEAARAAAADAVPIAIGLIAPLSGGTVAQGKAIRDGARLAVAEINSQGGVLARPLALIERDDQSVNEIGGRLADELTVGIPVVAALGVANTGVALAAEPFFEEAEIPLIISAATGTRITRLFAPPEYAENYIFRVAADDSLQASMIAGEVLARSFRKIAILHDTTSYGRLGQADLERELNHRGVAPVAIEKFNIGDTDMRAQLERARAAGAEVILTYGIGPELANIANGRAAVGWLAPLIGSWTLSMDSFIDIAARNADGAIMPQTFIEDPDTPRRKAFLDAFHSRYQTDRISTPPAAAQSYDAVYLLAAAIEQAGSTDGRKIKAALEDLQKPLVGVVTTYDHPFSATDHEAIKRANVVFGIVRSGRVQRAEPRDERDSIESNSSLIPSAGRK